jgi:LDH2 family malate/lactate/ureidoglycolate dehydrogenase
MSERYAAADLERFAAALFGATGLMPERARSMAHIFVEADLLGFTTHGLGRVPANLAWLASGHTRKTGDPVVLKDRSAVLSLDAGFLPGPWVVQQAVAEAARRARATGVAVISVRRCTHVACLAAYLLPLIEQRLVGIMTVSTPDERFISPFGGREAVFSNNPLAFCAPTSSTPLLFDVSMAITAGGQIARAYRERRRLPEAALKTALGEASDDPAVMRTSPPGTVMPIGGLEHGHKGYALTLMTEVLTQALSGHGRRDAVGDGEANAIFIEVLDPLAFTDWSEYLAQVDHLLDACRRSLPDDPAVPVRVPGERAWSRRRRALEEGLELYPDVLSGMGQWAERLAVEIPRPL